MLTIGQLAECTGVSEKALRIYEKKGLIHSKRNVDNNYRYYDESEKENIEKIIMFKFLGFSLEQIGEMLENGKQMGMVESLKQQRWLLEQKRNQLDTMIYCMDRVIVDYQENNIDIDDFLDSMQYIIRGRSADVQIAELYKHSNKAQHWNLWVFEQAQIREGLSILDAGAGWGNLWRQNQNRIPNECKITCIDKHNTWADEFEKFVKEETEEKRYPPKTFSFLWGDMEEMDLQGRYDRIFLNHVAFFLKDSKKMIEKLRDCLQEDGIFISTLGGAIYYDEAEKLLKDFAQGLPKGREKFIERIHHFSEKRKEKIQKEVECVEEVFPKMEKRIFEIELVFDENECYDFLVRTYSRVKSELEKHESELLEYLKQVRIKKGRITFKKDTYLLFCKR